MHNTAQTIHHSRFKQLHALTLHYTHRTRLGDRKPPFLFKIIIPGYALPHAYSETKDRPLTSQLAACTPLGKIHWQTGLPACCAGHTALFFSGHPPSPLPPSAADPSRRFVCTLCLSLASPVPHLLSGLRRRRDGGLTPLLPRRAWRSLAVCLPVTWPIGSSPMDLLSANGTFKVWYLSWTAVMLRALSEIASKLAAVLNEWKTR